MSTDDIGKAFENVSPLDIIEQYGEHFFEHSPGPEDFQAFINRHLYSVQYAFVAGDGVINPVCALSDARTERLFGCDDTETLKELLERMRTMAQATGSTRFFFSRLIPVTMVAAGTPQLGAGDAQWKASLLWFAEDKVTGERKQGTMAAVSKARLGTNTAAPLMGGTIGEWLHGVLA